MAAILGTIAGFLASNAPAIGAASAIAGAGTTIGEAIAGAGGGGSPSPTTPTTPPGPTPPNLQELLQKKSLVSSADANTQAQTAGTAGDFYRLITDQLKAGTLGTAGSQGAAQSVVGGQSFQAANNQPTNALPGQIPSLSDFINSFSG